MSDNRSQAFNKTKSILYAIVAIAILTVAILGGLWLLDLWPSSENLDVLPPYDAFDTSFYDFEINDGIKEQKAASAYHKLKSLTKQDKLKMSPTVYNALIANQKKSAVQFTDVEKVGLVHVIGVVISKNPKLMNSLCKRMVKNHDNDKPTLKNLIIELACHIKMRKENGKISLANYDAYLYENEVFADFKDDITGLEDLNERARSEHVLVEVEYYRTPEWKKHMPQIYTMKDIDTVLPKKNKI